MRLTRNCTEGLCVNWKDESNQMPYSDHDKANNYQREYRRLRRAGDSCTTPGTTPIPSTFAYKPRRTLSTCCKNKWPPSWPNKRRDGLAWDGPGPVPRVYGLEAVKLLPKAPLASFASPASWGPALHQAASLCIGSHALRCDGWNDGTRSLVSIVSRFASSGCESLPFVEKPVQLGGSPTRT
jgi:hypothetical protein